MCNELVLINHNPDKAKELAIDLADGSGFLSRFVTIREGDWSDCARADVVVVTAGPKPKPGETRMQELGAATVAGLVSMILWNERSVVSVSTLIDGEYEYEEHDVFLSLPVALDCNGVGYFVDLHLNDEELSRFRASAAVVREHCALIAGRL